MKPLAILVLAVGLVTARAEESPFSRQYLQVKQFSQEDNEAVLKQFEGLRVADVVDGLDSAGLQGVTVMDAGIRPLWRDEEKFSHRIVGLAVTLRLFPAQERTPHFSSYEEFDKWVSQWYSARTPFGFEHWLKPGTVLVVDASEIGDVGFCGSNNTLSWLIRGVRGVVTDGGCRDADEITLQRIPVYHRGATRGILPGRAIYESYNYPVNVGGVLVMPGDIVFGDSEGVLVVPRAKADAVAAAARKIMEADKVGRRRMYERLNRPLDFTVK